MPFKFEQLRIWSQSLDYIDLIYDLASQLPRSAEYNLKSQITRAATSVALNIAEGSISQSNPEQVRFLSMAIRSLVETIACQHIINRRQMLPDRELLRQTYRAAEVLVANIHTMRRTLLDEGKSLRESSEDYSVDLASE